MPVCVFCFFFKDGMGVIERRLRSCVIESKLLGERRDRRDAPMITGVKQVPATAVSLRFQVDISDFTHIYLVP